VVKKNKKNELDKELILIQKRQRLRIDFRNVTPILINLLLEELMIDKCLSKKDMHDYEYNGRGFLPIIDKIINEDVFDLNKFLYYLKNNYLKMEWTTYSYYKSFYIRFSNILKENNLKDYELYKKQIDTFFGCKNLRYSSMEKLNLDKHKLLIEYCSIEDEIEYQNLINKNAEHLNNLKTVFDKSPKEQKI